MIPKPGDKVTLDPWYENLMRDELLDEGFTNGIFGIPLKVVHVADGILWTEVTVSEPHIRTFHIAKGSGRWHVSANRSEAPALFMPSLETLAAEAVAVSELKIRNTDPEAQTCAKCGGALKDPVPGVPIFRHCPVCEP